jgi:cytochrome c556
MKHILWMMFYSAFLLLAGFPPGPCAALDEHHDHFQDSMQASTTSPLVEEMKTLDNAFRDIVSAVALSDTAKVHASLQSMHGAMEKTHEGMHTGTVVLPKNASRSKEFMERDKIFHEKLDALDRAARRDNRREMLRITKQLLDGCVQCHQTFGK